MNRIIILLFLLIINIKFISAQINFTPLALDNQNNFLFNSIETIGDRKPIKTLFYGSYNNGETLVNSYSFYPMVYNYSKNNKILYIQNKIGLYYYDIKENSVKTITNYPSFEKKNEYPIYRLPIASISPDYRYIVTKIANSSTKADIHLIDNQENIIKEVVKDVEISPGYTAAKWSSDSGYFIYQKNGSIYYFSLSDYKKNKLLNENWRWIGKTRINNCYWTKDNYLIWIENNLIYRCDPNQFFSRSIYRNYLRQGEIIGKIPFKIDANSDNFIYNDESKNFIISKGGASIFYYSLTDDIKQNPYIQLNDNMRFDKADLFANGEGIISVDILDIGKVSKKIFLIKKGSNHYQINELNKPELLNAEIFGYSTNEKNSQILINSSNGAFCYDIKSENMIWKFSGEAIINSANVGESNWIVGGEKLSYLIKDDNKFSAPIFASSVDDAGYVKGSPDLGIIVNNTKYFVDIKNRTINTTKSFDFELIKEVKNNTNRLLSREINMGFYKEAVYLKDLYSGKQIEITGIPNLKYKLYQPEIESDYKFYYSPNSEKYEIALAIDCTKTAEGVYPILKTIYSYKIPLNFFINGNFIDINKTITKIISTFDVEVSNIFQYDINLTDKNILIDKNFIRQGLSANEEKYFNLTGKNFAPYWHAPMFFSNETIIKFANDAGYRYISYNYDTFDWVDKYDYHSKSAYYPNNYQIIDNILKNLKPGQVIFLSAGNNFKTRDEWLYDDFDLLISELIRSGYNLTFVSDHVKKYRK